MKSFTERKTYTNENGTNFQNQQRKHRLLNIPVNRYNSDNFIQITADDPALGKGSVTNSSTGFAASRLLVKREKSRLSNCTTCGKLFD
jgi:hypothetical protein